LLKYLTRYQAYVKGEGIKDASMDCLRDGQIIPPEVLADVEGQLKKNFSEGN
jgi:hypothetical protein